MAANPLKLPIDDLAAHLTTLMAELQGGHTVELVNGDEVIGEVRARAAAPAAGSQPRRPDFAAQLQHLWGDRTLEIDVTNWVREDRDA